MCYPTPVPGGKKVIKAGGAGPVKKVVSNGDGKKVVARKGRHGRKVVVSNGGY